MQRSQVFVGVQYLRGIAAMLVVLHHASSAYDGGINPLKNYYAPAAGVDVFFVISGFIMYSSARCDEARSFLGRRIARIVPLYWIATLAALVMFEPDMHAAGTEPTYILKSLLFMPYVNPYHEGHVWPFLAPGWTLNYEMFFYGLFAIGLLFRRPLAFASGTIIVLVLAGNALSISDPVTGFYMRPILIEFVCGMLIALLNEQGLVKRMDLALLIGLVWLLWPDPISMGFLPDRLPSAVLCLLGAICLEKRGWFQRLPLLKQLGDASYSIYLAHTLFIWGVVLPYLELPLGGTTQFYWMVAVSLIGSALAGVVVHKLLEKPIVKIARRIFRPAPQIFPVEREIVT